MNKRNLILIIVATVFIFAGCKKEEKDSTTNPKKVQLEQELILLNQSITLTQVDDSKGPFWDACKKGLKVAGADIVGAGAGLAAGAKIAGVVGLATGGAGAIAVEVGCGVVAGAGASIAAYGSSAGNGSDGNGIKYPFEIDIYSCGYLHNQIVEQHYSEKPLPLIDILYKANVKDAEKVIKLYQSKQFQEFMKKLLEDTKKYATDFDMTKFIQKCNYFSENVALVLDCFFQKYFQIEDMIDILKVVETYETFIKQDKLLSKEEKEIIMVSLSVAKYSPFYWLSITK